MPEDRIIETSRPAGIVTFVVKVNGSEVPQEFKAETINISKEVNRIPTARIVFIDGNPSDGKFEASNGNLFIPGNEVEVLAGYESDNYLIFKGIIIKQSVKIRSDNALLFIECKDRMIRATVGTKNKYYTDGQKDSEIISGLLARYTPDTDIEETEVKHKELVQYETTDWDFLVNRADVNGRLVFVDDGKVAVKKPDFKTASVLSLVYGATILELDAEIDARLQLKAVQSQSWSSGDQEITKSDITDPAVSLNGNLSTASLADVIGLESFKLKHGGEVSGEELQNWGKAFWWKHQAAKVRGRVRFKGIHTVKPGMLIDLSGVSDRVNGKCFVSGIQHHISAGDWQTDAQLGVNPEWFTREQDIMPMPASGLLSGVCGLQVAIVTQLEDDPDGQNRIKVFLPIIDSAEQGFWARVSTLDAGKDRGSFFLPEPGDEVIVGFINDDPRDAIVLGMMNSSNKPAPLKAEAKNNTKGFVTRSKMQMLFDDDKVSFTLLTPGERSITVDDQTGIIKLEDKNGNKILMNADGITIESCKDITMRAAADYKLDAVNIASKASASLKGEASASVEMKASGSMTIKGGIVKIN